MASGLWGGAFTQIASPAWSQAGFVRATLGTVGFVWARASPGDSQAGPGRASPGSAHGMSKWPMPSPARANPGRDLCGLERAGAGWFTTGWPWASPGGARLGIAWASPCPDKSQGAQGCPYESRLGSGRARYLGLMPNDTNLPDRAIAAVANELEERKKRNRSIVLHNVPEKHDKSNDVKAVVQILQKVSGKEVEIDQMCNTPRIYRLGQYGASSRNKPRSIKVHLKSTEECNEILQNTRKLSQSVQYSSVVIQPDLTPMQHNQIRMLVAERKRRNSEAIANNEDPDWTISSGFLHRRRNYHWDL